MQVDAGVWMEIEVVLRDVFAGRLKDPLTFQKAYTLVFDICTSPGDAFNTTTHMRYSIQQRNNNNAQLYNKLKQFIVDYVSGIFEKSENMDEKDYLVHYSEYSQTFRTRAKHVDAICSYLNGHYIQRKMYEDDPSFLPIGDLCLAVWKDALYRTDNYKLITDLILKLINEDRSGKDINRNLIKNVLQSYAEYAVGDAESQQRYNSYKEDFEHRFLQSAEEYYRTEAGKIMSLSKLEYVKPIKKWLSNEKERCKHCTIPVRKENLRKVMKKVLIKAFFLPRLLFHMSHGQFFEEGVADDWDLVNSLCEPDEDLVKIQKLLEDHLTRQGLETIESAGESIGQDATRYVAKLHEVFQQQSELVKKAFNDHSEAIKALDKAAKVYVNKNAKSSEMLAKFCNQLLKKSSRGNSYGTLDQALILFKYLEDKDIFSKIYTRLLSRRLIHETSANEEAENSFIGELGLECGLEYTRHLCTMLNDVKNSEGLTADFRPLCQSKNLPELRVTIVNTCSWPTMSPTSFELPMGLLRCVAEFTQFYNKKYSGRKLTWILSQSQGELLCNGFESKKIFSVTTAQMAILMLFNRSLTYTVKNIGDILQMDKKTVAQTITSLIKSRVLLGEMPESGGDDDDGKEVKLNLKYAEAKYKIDLTKVISRPDPQQEQQKIVSDVDTERRCIIKACIVRIMKTKRSSSHQLLLNDVLQQLSARFNPKVELVKRCIEQLIENEFIRRSEEQTDLYEYIA